VAVNQSNLVIEIRINGIQDYIIAYNSTEDLPNQRRPQTDDQMMMNKVLIASNNQGKLREFLEILHDFEAELVTPADIGLNLAVTEDGSTYQENAARKAIEFAAHSGMVTLADDSGLEVESLGGAPGIYSARYSNKLNATDQDRRLHLLDQLAGKPRPWLAQFRCVVALAVPSGVVHFSEGICKGEIIPEERGDHGFGYDPIFFIPEYRCTMAELLPDVKNQISHRGRAVKAAQPVLEKLLSAYPG